MTKSYLLLKIEKIKYYINSKLLFDNFSLTAESGSIINIKGPNGSGKTTLFRIISGLIKPDSGTVELNRKNILSLEKPYCLYLTHSSGFKEDLTTLENLVFWGKLYNSLKNLKEATDYLKLESILDKKFYQLSAGQQKRAILSKIILCTSNLYLLDEVDTHLDQEGLELLKQLIINKANDGNIILFSSHYAHLSNNNTIIFNKYV